MPKARWAIFISGRGSNANSVLQSGQHKICLAFSSKAGAAGNSRFKRAGVPLVILPKAIDWMAVQRQLQKYRITHIFLLGFMKLIPGDFLKHWERRIFNIHPSLLPAYPGLRSFERSYQDHANVGVTVHHVITEMDAGERIFQKKILDKQDQRWPDQKQAQLLLSAAEQRLVQRTFDKISNREFRCKSMN
jgi:phosphoribosylglycinamide formyltransferase-1